MYILSPGEGLGLTEAEIEGDIEELKLGLNEGLTEKLIEGEMLGDKL